MVQIIIKKHSLFLDDDDYARLKNEFGDRPRIEIFEHQIRPYAVIRRTGEDGKRETIGMPRWIMGGGDNDEVVLFEDKNPLNMQRSNMRLGTKSQAQRGRTSVRSSTSKYKGVSLVKTKGKWRATIKPSATISNKYLGVFETEEAAAKAYNEAAKIYHGSDALLNMVGE